jgi:hypothetical protein
LVGVADVTGTLYAVLYLYPAWDIKWCNQASLQCNTLTSGRCFWESYISRALDKYKTVQWCSVLEYCKHVLTEAFNIYSFNYLLDLNYIWSRHPCRLFKYRHRRAYKFITRRNISNWTRERLYLLTTSIHLAIHFSTASFASSTRPSSDIS